MYQEAIKNIATRYVLPSLGLGVEGDIEELSSFFAADPERNHQFSQFCKNPKQKTTLQNIQIDQTYQLNSVNEVKEI